MEGNMFKKALVVGIIFLFIGVGVYPAIAVEPKQSIINQLSVKDCDVSKNNLEITEEVEKSEVNEKNDYDCLPCALKENILNNLHFSFPLLKLPFIICFIILLFLSAHCEFISGHDEEVYERCMDDMWEWFDECWKGE